MRIRKRLRSLMLPPDPSSPSPPSMAASEAAPAVAAAGGKEEELMAAAVEGGRGGGGRLHGSGSGSGGGIRGGGGGGRGLHPNGDLPSQHTHGCTTKLTILLPFHLMPPPAAAAAAEGEERGDLPPPGASLRTKDMPLDCSHGGEVPKRELQDWEKGGDGDARRRWRKTDANSAATATAPKCLGAQVSSQVLLGHGGHKTLPDGVSASTEAMEMWKDEERELPRKKRRACYRARGTRSGGEEGKNNIAVVDAKKEMKPMRSKTRRRAATYSSTTTIADAGAALITAAGTGRGGAPFAAGASAAKKCDDVVVKKEGADHVVSATAAVLLLDGNRGGGNGKKRRSPAVLMEGSRCSRVNGRGWRCCQQTLVGYSLCEHHLGKGRLRSVSSVRCNGRARKKEELDGAALSPPSPTQPPPQQHLLLSGHGEDEEENPGKRKRKKIGMVKARSISSLLHQPDYSTVPTALAAPEPSPPPSPAPAAAAPPHGSNIALV